MLTQEQVNAVFAQLRIIHKAHWKAPKVEEVKKEIAQKGAFLFLIGKDPYVAQVRITEDTISYEVNPALPERMRMQANDMKKKFERLF